MSRSPIDHGEKRSRLADLSVQQRQAYKRGVGLGSGAGWQLAHATKRRRSTHAKPPSFELCGQSESRSAINSGKKRQAGNGVTPGEPSSTGGLAGTGAPAWSIAGGCTRHLERQGGHRKESGRPRGEQRASLRAARVYAHELSNARGWAQKRKRPANTIPARESSSCAGLCTRHLEPDDATEGFSSGAGTEGFSSGAGTEGFSSGAGTEGFSSGAGTEGFSSGAGTEGFSSGAGTEGFSSGA